MSKDVIISVVKYNYKTGYVFQLFENYTVLIALNQNKILQERHKVCWKIIQCRENYGQKKVRYRTPSTVKYRATVSNSKRADACCCQADSPWETLRLIRMMRKGNMTNETNDNKKQAKRYMVLCALSIKEESSTMGKRNTKTDLKIDMKG